MIRVKLSPTVEIGIVLGLSIIESVDRGVGLLYLNSQRLLSQRNDVKNDVVLDSFHFSQNVLIDSVDKSQRMMVDLHDVTTRMSRMELIRSGL